MSDELEAWDIVTLLGYFVIVFAVGMVATCRANRGSSEGFFLAGKTMTFLPIAGSIYATNIGAPMFVGIAGSAAGVGIAPVMFEWHATYTLIFLGWVFVPIYIASGSFTMPEYLRKRFGGQRLRVFYAFIQLALSVLTGISGELFAGSLFINQILGWDIYLSTILILLVTSVYTIGGGLTAVIYTDTLQTIILILGSCVLAVLALDEVGGYEAMHNQFLSSAANNTYLYESIAQNRSCGFTPEDSFSIFRDMDSDYPWPGLIFGLTLLATYYWCTNQIIVQRNLAAKNVSHSKAACVIASYLKLLPFILFVIPGMVSRILFADEIACSDPDQCEDICDNRGGCSDIAYPLLVLRVMPTGMKGIMLAAMLAALMSSLTSQYNSCSSIFSMDIWRYFRRKCGKNPSDKELVIIGRVFGGVLVAISIAWLPILQKMKGTRLWDYIQAVSSFMTPPWVVVFLTGMFWKRTTEEGAWWSVVVGLIIGIIRMVIDFSNPEPRCGSTNEDDRPSIITEVHYLHFAILFAGICLIVNVVVSLMTNPRKSESLHRVTWWTRNDDAEPVLTEESEWTESEEEEQDPEELTTSKKIYNACCGFGAKQPKLTKEQEEEAKRKMQDISEDPLIQQICDVNGILAVAATCFIIGFYY